jgi:hypothetical protein
VFNKTYQSRAVRRAGGGHKVAEDEALRLPWANISRSWRPHALLAALAANRRQINEGGRPAMQLELFPLDLFRE